MMLFMAQLEKGVVVLRRIKKNLQKLWLCQNVENEDGFQTKIIIVDVVEHKL